MKRKLLIETPVCPRERLVIISYTTGLSFTLERIGPLAAIAITVFYLLVLYLFALPNTPENPFASIYSETLIKTTCQHLLLLVGYNTLIYRKYYDTPLYLWVISQLLVMGVPLLGWRQDLTEIVHRSLYSVLLAILCTLDHQGRTDNLICSGYVQQHRLFFSRSD
jgi:hypothetical protein